MIIILRYYVPRTEVTPFLVAIMRSQWVASQLYNPQHQPGEVQGMGRVYVATPLLLITGIHYYALN